MSTIEVVQNKIWKPHPKQLEFIRIPDSVDEAFFGGAAGPGKSEVLMMLPIAREWYKLRGWKGIIFRRTFPELEESHIPNSKNWYPYFGGVYNETKHRWIFPEYGTWIQFGYMERDDDARSHDTAEFNYAAFDELTHFSKFQYEYITFSRIRTSIKGHPTVCRSASNPGNVGHRWVRERFINPHKPGGKILVDEKTGLKRIFIHATALDNPTLLEANPEYLKKLNSLPPGEREAKLYGDWDAFSGQVFSEFRSQHWPHEPENAVHVIKPFDVPEWWPKVVSTDWGFTHKNAIHWGAIAPEGRVFVYREKINVKTNVKVWAADAARLSQFDGNIVGHVIDPSAKQDRGLGSTIKDQAEEASGWQFDCAENDRISGVNLIHEFLRWEARPKRYDPKEGYSSEREARIFRLYGSKAAEGYRKLFEPEKEEKNLPKLQIFDTCPDLIETLPLCVYAQSTKENLQKAEDVLKFDGDDSFDNLKYLLQAIDYYNHNLEKEAEKRQQLGTILQTYAQTNDYHNFHLAMERYEARNSKVISINRPRYGLHRRAVGR